MCKAVSSALGLVPKMPALPTLPAPPPVPEPPPVPTQMQPGGELPKDTAQSPAARDAADAARRAAMAQRGRATTILTGAQGLTGTEAIARPTATKVLLGG